MAQPADTKDVLQALRLGWCVAELRGRTTRPQPAATAPLSGYPLPLRTERSDADLQSQAADLLGYLAGTLAVDDDTAANSKTVVAAIADPDTFAKLLYNFDSHVQNKLTEASEQQGCAYLLGRGLAEAYWALDPNHIPKPPAKGQPTPAIPPTDPTSWTFLLGQSRTTELSQLLGRLAEYFNPFTAPAIAGSLVVWNKVAESPTWLTQPNKNGNADQSVAFDALYQQTRRWYELLIFQQDPTSLIKPFALLRNFKTAWNSVRLFFPQLLGGLAGVGALSAAAWTTQSGQVQAFLGALGASGLSLSALHAKAKSSAQGLTKRLQQDAYTDLITVSITVVPARHTRETDGTNKTFSATRRAVSAALTDRRLTTGVSV